MNPAEGGVAGDTEKGHNLLIVEEGMGATQGLHTIPEEDGCALDLALTVRERPLRSLTPMVGLATVIVGKREFSSTSPLRISWAFQGPANS